MMSSTSLAPEHLVGGIVPSLSTLLADYLKGGESGYLVMVMAALAELMTSFLETIIAPEYASIR